MRGLYKVLGASVSIATLTACNGGGGNKFSSLSANNATSLSSTAPVGQISNGGLGVSVSNAGNNSSTVICDPQSASTNSQAGLQATLYTTNATFADNVADMINNGQIVTSNVYLSQLNIPTTSFINGFTSANGQQLVTSTGSVIKQDFALDIKGNLSLTSSQSAGDYQLAVISSDGAIVSIEENGEMIQLINNDGIHQSQMGCADTIITMQQGAQVPIEVQYFNGSEADIALTLLWRPVTSSSLDTDQDPLCNAVGNSKFWDPTQTPSAPTANYAGLLARGWTVISPNNFSLSSGSNPCVGPAPQASSSAIASPSPTPSVNPSSSPSPVPSVTPSAAPSVAPSPLPSSIPHPSASSSSTPIICDPNNPAYAAEYGLKGTLYSANSSDVANVQTMISQGTQINASVYLNQVNVPTTEFTQGFTTTAGNKLKDNNGNLLIEYFALDLKSQLTLSPSDPEGYYQIALLSDDGATMTIQNSNGQSVMLVDNDGVHATRMGCSTQTLNLHQGDVVPFELKWYQGPRYQIALTMMWRKVSSASASQDALCGTVGETAFWDATKTPSAPLANYATLLADGWNVVGAQNFLLQAAEKNPCVSQGASCSSYVPVQDQDFEIPARDASNTCYYVKMMNQTAYVSSEDYTQMRTDINAADHDGLTPNPRITGTDEIGFSILGNRDVILAGDAKGTVSMFFDNFLLVELENMYGLNLFGYGTGDSVPSGGQITVDGQPVSFQAFAPAGEATVPPVDLTPIIPVNQPVILRASGLDCGVLGQASNVYLLFR